MTATIHDVALRAGCSIASVSRVLNGSAAISPALEARVREAIRELGYRPNALGRSLKTKSTRTVGVLVPSFTNPVFAASLAGVEQAARMAGCVPPLRLPFLSLPVNLRLIAPRLPSPTSSSESRKPVVSSPPPSP